VFDRFVAGFVAATRALRIGDPMDEATQAGPLVSANQREISETFLKEARAAGRTILIGGDRPGPKGFYLNPAVVTGIDPSDRIWREEIFGPVVCIRPFDDEEAMLEEVNASPYGLSASLWTNDLKRAIRVSNRIESGVISVNCHNSVHLDAPFGGFKASGLGRDLGMEALANYTEVKNVYVAP
jgi:acyl-CoA reductase-like NAD-dependent aldehyde dehydrogenase